MEKKRQFGQFFTRNADYILNGFSNYIKDKEVIDPFAGNQDLMFWANKHGAKKVTGLDIDQRYVDNKKVFQKDSINCRGRYKFVLTNPPYLHKNKAKQEIKEKYFNKENSFFEDLYQISLNAMSNSEEGIVIVPLNFLSAENSSKIRRIFFEKFKIIRLNIFSEQVFEDTTYNVISFYFRRKKYFSDRNKIPAVIFPEKKRINFIIEKKHNWQLGGDFINRIKNTKNDLGVFRLTEDYLRSGEYKVEMALQNIKDKRTFQISKDLKRLVDKNILFLRAIDSKNGKKIQLEDIRKYGIAGLVGKNTSRNMAHLIFKEEIPIEKQIKLKDEFNKILNRERNKHLSFFLTNFRDNNRKRISFDWVYKFLNFIYYEENKKQPILF
jgi:16S rRNA G966 N2-methylase RsmD